MGAADIVPGVSGGTMAFILGIYEDLIEAIRLFGRRKFWSHVLSGKFRTALSLPRWNFLIPVGSGVLLAVALLSASLEHMLESSPTLVWSFFFGLVCASVWLVAARVKRWNSRYLVALIFGVLIAYVIVGLVPVETPNASWFLVLSGAIAICAMILPGISGAFLLVLLGKYEFVLSAVNSRDVMSVAYIGIGAVVGIIVFSQVLGWLFKHYHDLTVALLTGLMIGSLRKIWPWKLGEVNVLPELGPETYQVLAVMLTGAAMVGIIEYLAHRNQS